jgi:hypothetical protein
LIVENFHYLRRRIPTLSRFILPSSSTLVFEANTLLSSAPPHTLSPAVGGWMTALPGVESHRSSEVRAKASLERRLINYSSEEREIVSEQRAIP